MRQYQLYLIGLYQFITYVISALCKKPLSEDSLSDYLVTLLFYGLQSAYEKTAESGMDKVFIIMFNFTILLYIFILPI